MRFLDDRHQEIAKPCLPSTFSLSEESPLLQAVTNGNHLFLYSRIYVLRSLCLNTSSREVLKALKDTQECLKQLFKINSESDVSQM